jgi:hypothetical protein
MSDNFEYLYSLTKEIVISKNKDIKRLQARIADLEQLVKLRNMEIDQFNAGFEAARDGKPESDHPNYDIDTDDWLPGYAWGAFEPMKQRIAELEKDLERKTGAVDGLRVTEGQLMQMIENLERENAALKEAQRIDKSTWFYKNCKRQRKCEAKICQVCPFRKSIEQQEKHPESI